jgi:hypothetical protein
MNYLVLERDLDLALRSVHSLGTSQSPKTLARMDAKVIEGAPALQRKTLGKPHRTCCCLLGLLVGCRRSPVYDGRRFVSGYVAASALGDRVAPSDAPRTGF